MRPHIAFLKCLARGLAKHVGAFPQGFAGSGFAKVLPEAAADAWKLIARSFDEEQRRQLLQATLQKSPQDIKADLPEIIQDLPQFKAEAAKKALLAYLVQVPASIRQAVSRPSDPAGKTVPPALPMSRGEELLKLLPKPLPAGTAAAGKAAQPAAPAKSARAARPAKEPLPLQPIAETDSEGEIARQPSPSRKPKRSAPRSSSRLVLAAAAVAIAAALVGVGSWFVIDMLSEDKPKGDAAQASPTTAPNQPTKPGTPIQPGPTTASGKPTKPTPTKAKPTTPTAGKPTTAVPTLPADPNRRFHNRALLVGLRNYAYAATVNALVKEGPDADPLGLFALAQDLTRHMGFAANQVGHLTDVRRNNETPPPLDGPLLEAHIAQFLDSCRTGDSVLLVVVGHAAAIGEKGFLVPPAGERHRPETLLPIDWLYKRLAECKARHKLVIFDVAANDPRDWPSLGGGEPLSEELAKALANAPNGTEVWVSCAAGQNSIYNGSAGQNGSAFLQALLSWSDLRKSEARTLLSTAVASEAWALPLLRLKDGIFRDTAVLAKQVAGTTQTPQAHGRMGTGPDPAPGDPPPPAVSVTPLAALNGQELAFARDVVNELYGSLPAAERPQADRYAASKPERNTDYQPDYKSAQELKQQLAAKPVRAAVLETDALIQKVRAALASPVLFNANANAFNADIIKRQELVATLVASLNDQRDKLEKLIPASKKETNRWQAHFELTHARLLGAIVFAQEHNYVLGVSFRKDKPEFKDKNHNGWRIVPQERILQKEMRDIMKIRAKQLQDIIQRHAGTPWESLARLELASFVGRMAVEARVR